MKKTILPLMAFLCAFLLFAGCAGQLPTDSAAPTTGAVTQEITKWPENEYTGAIPNPKSGTPDRVIFDDDAGYYAIFLEDITREQGEQYIETLKTNGFETVAGDSNSAAAGETLQKGSIRVGVSASDETLGIYITLSCE